MVTIGAKALRFARMAAAGAKADDSPFFATIMSSQSGASHAVRGDVSITAAEAQTYLRCIEAVLRDTVRFEHGDLDGNDYEFLKIVKDALRQQLAEGDGKHLSS